MERVTNSLKELKKEEAKKPGALTPLSSVSAHERVDTKSFYSIYTQRITEMEKENKELRAKCVDNATLAKEAADLRVEVEAKEKELAATVEELRVLKEKCATIVKEIETIETGGERMELEKPIEMGEEEMDEE